MTIKNILSISLLFTLLFSLPLSHAELDSKRKAQLEHLLKHDCGSCHGMTLKGGLGPALLSDSLKHKDNDFLFITIKQGRPGTPMPAWKSQLSDEEINWLIRLLRNPNTVE